ncbi:hypothetical protein POM88_029486 [Heracleum sosnowskyi]|uniref:Uncharacterized protein n=1 Tax=Heracleum sosnowskyi TaxID=360622 RepID=A0AAD8MII7_9APIA|nr:hypothetical protein POM88_029486 [Heracleum sosnowskyi]
MPDLGTLLNPRSSSSTLEIPCPNFKPPDQCEPSTSPVPDSVKTLDTNHNCSDWEQRLRFPIHSPKKLRALKRCRSKNTNKTTTTSEQEDKSPDEISVGVSGQQCVLPFLGARIHIYVTIHNFSLLRFYISVLPIYLSPTTTKLRRRSQIIWCIEIW